jgi:hypothetical protein
MIESFRVKGRMMPAISRRSLILGGASAATTVAVGIRLPAGALETITVDQFRALSATLTGASVTELDATTVGKLLDGFISMGRADQIWLSSPPILGSAAERWPMTSSPRGILESTIQARALPRSA